MLNNPFNPLNWVQSAQNWFRKTEISSGFRPYLIFLIVHAGFSLTLLVAFHEMGSVVNFVINTLYFSFIGFVVLFAIKSFQEPGFCRSEKHIENVKRLELMEQKGDIAPKLVQEGTHAISNPEFLKLTNTNGGER